MEIEQDIELYYTAPSPVIFEDIKTNALIIWAQYYKEEEPTYAQEKVRKVMDLPNVKDNYMYIIAMFDHINQSNLMTMLKTETLKRLEPVMPSSSMVSDVIDRLIEEREDND